MKRRIVGVVGLVTTILLLWWVLRDVSAEEVLSEVRLADPWLLALMVMLATFSFVLRAYRWKVLLEPGHDGSSFDARFGAVCTGFAANNLFPARVGEVVRAYVLSRVAAIPFGASVGSLVVERVLDGLVLALMLVGSILMPGFPLGESAGAATVRRVAVIGSIVFALSFVVLWAAARRPDRAVRAWIATGGRLVPRRFAGRIESLVDSFVRGLGALADPLVLARSIAWSCILWGCLSASMWAGLLAFDITAPGLTGTVFLQAVAAFSVAVPSTPGFFGVFEAGARLGLQPWHIDEAAIVGFATTYHILTFIPVTLIGLWYLRRFGMRWDDVRHRAEEPEGVGVGRSE